MSKSDWSRFDRMVESRAWTDGSLARANGQVVSELLHARASSQREPVLAADNWLDWEAIKARRLLWSAGPTA
jgi:hypothetical protein